MLRCSVVCASTAATSAPPSLLGYSIRRSAASEMLYGGVRLRHLAGHPFALHKIRSEDMPSPSLERERHDLRLEMQLPRDVPGGYNQVNMNIQRQLASEASTEDAAGDATESNVPHWDMGEYFGRLHHPERHHNSSLPYSMGDTNNVMALRLFPLNLHSRMRTEGVRIRTQDCLDRLRDAQLCQSVGKPVEFPLPLSKRYAYARLRAEQTAAPSASSSATTTTHRHLRGGHCHPSPKDLSIFTRSVDRMETSGASTASSPPRPVKVSNAGGPLPFYVTASSAPSSAPRTMSAFAWKPLQMLKPITQSWSASMRSTGARGPHMQLMQERLDQKGFGWKRKSRSLWQQDIATAGFRPHRYF